MIKPRLFFKHSRNILIVIVPFRLSQSAVRQWTSVRRRRGIWWRLWGGDGFDGGRLPECRQGWKFMSGSHCQELCQQGSWLVIGWTRVKN